MATFTKLNGFIEHLAEGVHNLGSGATAGAALVDYSGLASATAAEYLLADVDTDTPSQAGHDAGGWPTFPLATRRRHRDHDTTILLAILH